MALRDPRGAWKTFTAVAYATTASVSGAVLTLYASSITVAILAVVLGAHGRAVSAYLVHECCHSSVFYERRWNTVLGTAMLWVSLCPYCDFEHVKRLHVAHHIDRADVRYHLRVAARVLLAYVCARKLVRVHASPFHLCTTHRLKMQTHH